MPARTRVYRLFYSPKHSVASCNHEAPCQGEFLVRSCRYSRSQAPLRADWSRALRDDSTSLCPSPRVYYLLPDVNRHVRSLSVAPSIPSGGTCLCANHPLVAKRSLPSRARLIPQWPVAKSGVPRSPRYAFLRTVPLKISE